MDLKWQRESGGTRALVLNGALIKRLRLLDGLSQEALSQACVKRRLCVSTSSVKRAEQEKPVIYRTARALADYFDVSVADLIQPPTTPAPAPERSADHERPASPTIELDVLIGGLLVLADLLKSERGRGYRRLLTARGGSVAGGATRGREWLTHILMQAVAEV